MISKRVHQVPQESKVEQHRLRSRSGSRSRRKNSFPMGRRHIRCQERMVLGNPLSRLQQAFARLLARFHKKSLCFRSSLDEAGRVAHAGVAGVGSGAGGNSQPVDRKNQEQSLTPRARCVLSGCYRKAKFEAVIFSASSGRRQPGPPWRSCQVHRFAAIVRSNQGANDDVSDKSLER